MWSRPFKRSPKTPWPRFTNIKSLLCFGIIPMHWSDCPIFFFRRPKTPSPTSPTLCDPVSRSDPRTAVLASLGHLVRFYTTHQKMCCISGGSGFWLTWYATLQERSTFCQVHGLNEANSDYFAPCLWYKKIFDYILSEEKLWFYVCQRQCSRVRKYSDLCVQAPVRSTCKGSLQFIRNGHLLWNIITFHQCFLWVGPCDDSEHMTANKWDE